MVGLYNGANMGLLKTVFEVNLQLFQKEGFLILDFCRSPKTCLLFVFRDFTGQVALDTLGQTLVSDLNKIWVLSLLICRTLCLNHPERRKLN
jgi:hypothetical protein